MLDVTIREIVYDDLFNGFLETLDSLRLASDIDKEKAKQILEKIQENPDHTIYVAILDNRVVGSTTLFIEPKFIHKGGLVGHIEDVVVSQDFQGKGIGEKLIRSALERAAKNGCYKTVLDCADEVMPFYEKLGFTRHSNAMRFDHISSS